MRYFLSCVVMHGLWWTGVSLWAWTDDCAVLRISDGWDGAYDCLTPAGIAW